tara:strand:+ start:30 stop:530 length:501 start_codon:yes stop_codon:yes gene_type:complete
MWGAIFGGIGLLISAVGTIGGLLKQNKAADRMEDAAKAQQRAMELQQKRNKLEIRRSKLKVIRETRIKRAAAVARAQSQIGGFGGSVQGGVGSIISQGSAQFGFLQQSSAFTLAARREMQQSTIFNNQAVQLRNEASLWQGFGSIGGTIFKQRDALSKIGQQLGVL